MSRLIPLPARLRRRVTALPLWIYPTLAMTAFLLAWEAAVDLFEVPVYLVPAPSAVLASIGANWQLIVYHTWVTLNAVLIGYLLSIAISVPLAAVLTQLPWVEKGIYPLLVASQTIPKVAIAPLLVVWFGFGVLPKILIVFLICFFPIVVDTMIGLKSVPREVVWLARSMGASQWDTFVRIRIPSALPHIFAGLKVASTLAVVGAVVAEFVGSDSGLGYELIVANGLLDVQMSFAVIVVLSAMGIVLFAAVDIAERLLLPWHISQRKVRALDTKAAEERR